MRPQMVVTFGIFIGGDKTRGGGDAGEAREWVRGKSTSKTYRLTLANVVLYTSSSNHMLKSVVSKVKGLGASVRAVILDWGEHYLRRLASVLPNNL
jgi:hypothetical protein